MESDRPEQEAVAVTTTRKSLRLFDRAVLVIGTFGPLMNLPQILKMFSGHDATGVSLFSWIAYTLYDIPWIAYGLMHKDKPITIAYSLWFLSNSVVLLGVLLYG